MAGLYIHIPFCKSRCIYCDFFSTTRTDRIDAYVDALCRELDERCRCGEFATIYIGGGTPSWIGIDRLERIFGHVCCRTSVETTIECNPDDVTGEFVDGLERLPVNRISLGIQSLTDERLRLLRRRHTASEAVEAVRRLQAASYENISIDMIYGLPGQTLDEWRRDLGAALALSTPHLSAYSLTYEVDTPLWQMREEHSVSEAHEELSIAMYEHLIDACAEAGLQQYELSNFARPGRESRHNSSYWEGLPYVGVGAGAHSFDGEATRRWNTPNLDLYIRQHDHNIERLSARERFNEIIFTALRTRGGVDWRRIEQEFPTEAATIRKIADRHVSIGNLVWDSGRLRLTRQALFVSDDVMSDLMIV